MASGHDGYEYEQIRSSKRIILLTKTHEVRCVSWHQSDGSLVAFGRLTLKSLIEQIELQSPVQRDCVRISSLADSIAQGKQVRAEASFVLGREYPVDTYTGRPTGPGRITCIVAIAVGDGISFAQFSWYPKDQRVCQ